MFEVGNCAPTSALFEVALELHSLYGCFPSCAKSGLGYTVLMMCLYVSGCEHDVDFGAARELTGVPWGWLRNRFDDDE